MVRASKPPLALIAGPTASGKSALALELAKQSGGVIVNADSAQLYNDIPLLSAAPSKAELRSVEHRLYGCVDGAVAMSAADWAELARFDIEQVQAQGRLPILVGGTGLYLRTLLDGIAPVPPIDPAIRAEVRESEVADNLERLRGVDPEAAGRLGPNDKTRIARALEVVLSTGRPLKQWQGQREGGIVDRVGLRPLILLPPRDWLYQRCNARFAAMLDGGAMDEVRALLERNLPPSLPVMRAIGVREVAALVRGEASREEALAAGQQATRNYAKRQYTWFAHQPPADWLRFRETTEPVAAKLVEALAFLQSGG
jgi:tRNA dimethylallyltransferase